LQPPVPLLLHAAALNVPELGRVADAPELIPNSPHVRAKLEAVVLDGDCPRTGTVPKTGLFGGYCSKRL